MKATQLTTKSEAGLIRRNTNRAAQAPDKQNKSPSLLSLDTSREKTHLLVTQTVWLKKEKLNVRYAELGDPANPPVLLLHGVPENLQAWYAVAPLLAEKYHVLAFDWPGFGGSDPLSSPEGYTSRHFAEVIVDFMDSLHIRQANLVATDISLLPSLLVGLEYPARVSKLAVMDGIPFPRPQYASWELRSFAKKGAILGKALVCWFPGISAKIARIKGFYRGHSIPDEVRKEFMADGKSKSNQEAFLSYFQNFHIDQEYFESRSSEVKTPVLVVWGKYDRFINSKLGHEIAKKLPNATLEIIDKAGHYVHMDKPKQLVQVVINFLNTANQ
jgi:pimeloyl-ACP methyl ester carboxylesterase